MTTALAAAKTGFFCALMVVRLFRRALPRTSRIPVAVLMALSGWAAWLWFMPAGPVLAGRYWAPPVAAGLWVALVFSSGSRGDGPLFGARTGRRISSYNPYTWVLLAMLAALILAGYVAPRPSFSL